MFLGHYALSLAAKRAAPRTSLGALFAAATLADLLWPLFLLTGWERVTIVPGPNPFLRLAFDAYPLSHSLLTLIVWGAVYALLYRRRSGYARGAVVLALLVVSHWVLDLATHRPDMPLYPGSATLGLGLWTSVTGTLVVEGVMFVAGVVIYGVTTTPRDAVGRYGIWALVAFLAASYTASLFGPPPPSVGALAIFALVFGVLFVVWGWWADRHRDAAYSN
jgi:membrane-bound metal-dependent hydrolase YbcI (DUF457 family)